MKKIDIGQLARAEKREDLSEQMGQDFERESNTTDTAQCYNMEDEWRKFKDIPYECAADVLGFVKRSIKTGFTKIIMKSLLDQLHKAHLSWINDKNCAAERDAHHRIK